MTIIRFLGANFFFYVHFVVLAPINNFSVMSVLTNQSPSINQHNGELMSLAQRTHPGVRVIKPFSCSTQLSMKFKLLIITEIAQSN